MGIPIALTYWRKFICSLVMITFAMTSINIPFLHAQELILSKPGEMVHLSPTFSPAMLKGIKVHPDNPFRFDFILDKGDSVIPAQAGIQQQELLKQESTKLIKYFLASLTTPENDLWVNLSPYEKDRIIPNSFGLTEMGRDLLAQDYMLKQITASLIYPEDSIGKQFWKRIYEESSKKFGTTNIPVKTFNKVWIVPEKAVVYENAKAGTAYVVESKLKVMLEEDYLAIDKNRRRPGDMFNKTNETCPQADCQAAKPLNMKAPQVNNRNAQLDTSTLGSQIVREVVIPQLTKEINQGKNFTQLRQVYQSLILATWYKKKIKDSILSQVYTDKNKTAGINVDDPQEKLKIYEHYLKAFKKGVFNYIKDIDTPNGISVPKKYFSGGMFMKLGTEASNAMDNMFIDIISSSNLIDYYVEGLIGTPNADLGGSLNIYYLNKVGSLDDLYKIINHEFGHRYYVQRFPELYSLRSVVAKKEFVNATNELTGDLISIRQAMKSERYQDDPKKAVQALLRQFKPSIKLEDILRVFVLDSKMEEHSMSRSFLAHLVEDGLITTRQDLEWFWYVYNSELTELNSQLDSAVNSLNWTEFKTKLLIEYSNTEHRKRALFDNGMLVNKQFGNGIAPGGIDFKSDKMNVQVQNSGEAIQFHMNPAMLAQLRNTTGFSPVIINIQPMTDLPTFLGIHQ